MKSFARFLVILYICLTVKFTRSIIRNDISDRCIYLASPLSENELPAIERPLVYARSCSWESTKDRRRKSHSNQWVEIQPSTAMENVQPYFIRKVTNNSDETCLASVDNTPTVSSTCSSPQTSFRIERVKQSNFKGSVTSLITFKIKNVDGKCLTVQPGREVLIFKDCSSRFGLFQVWSVCRHTRRCDVDLTWSPREIRFPNSTHNATKSHDMSSIKIANVETTASGCNLASAVGTHSVIMNEILYTVQNALKIFDSSEYFIAGSITGFYPMDSVTLAAQQLLKVCQDEDLKCGPCRNKSIDMGISAEHLTDWLFKWMDECNSGLQKKAFLSEDVLQVPFHLFPSHVPSFLRELPQEERLKLISSLKRYLHDLEAITHGNHENNKAGKYPNVEGTLTTVNNEQNTNEEMNGSDKLMQNADMVKGESGFLEHKSLNQTDDILSLIDVRLFTGQRKNNSTRTRSY